MELTKEERQKMRDLANEVTLSEQLITACDAALNWADANARGFPIETAPRDRGFIAWNTIAAEWISFGRTNEFLDYADDTYTHWAPLPPPPSNPPLPAPLERLGEVLRRIKGVG